jgi:hypothetical protein
VRHCNLPKAEFQLESPERASSPGYCTAWGDCAAGAGTGGAQCLALLRSHIVVMGVFVIRSIGLLFDAWPRRRCATQARATVWTLIFIRCFWYKNFCFYSFEFFGEGFRIVFMQCSKHCFQNLHDFSGEFCMSIQAINVRNQFKGNKEIIR